MMHGSGHLLSLREQIGQKAIIMMIGRIFSNRTRLTPEKSETTRVMNVRVYVKGFKILKNRM